MQQIDLNCDMGEGFGNDAILLDYVTSANIACGFHAGNSLIMQQTVNLCIKKGVSIGAHPGLPDLQNFGRVEMDISPDEAYQITIDQIKALHDITNTLGARLHHVKPHGALYNMAARDAALAKAIAQAVYDFDSRMILYGLAGSEMITAAKAIGLATASEVFADRTYQDDGSLISRKESNALISDEQQAVSQVLMMVKQQQVTSVNNKTISLKAETLCLHGDGEHAVAFAQLISAKLKSEGITIKAPTI